MKIVLFFVFEKILSRFYVGQQIDDDVLVELMLSDSQGIEDDSILAGLFYHFDRKKKKCIFLYLADVKQTDDDELLDNEM